MTYVETLRHVEIPRLPQRLVTRPALEKRLDSLAPVTVVRGLPGTGKTMVVAQWVTQKEKTGFGVIWITAQPDSDAAEIVEAASVVQDRPVIVVVDDAHYFTEREAAGDLLDLVNETADLHLVLIARTYHPLEHMAAAMGLSQTLISGADLMVTAPQLKDYANAWGYELGGLQAARLYIMVGGWLQPSRAALESSTVASSGLDIGAARRFCQGIVPTARLGLVSRLALADEVDQGLAAAIVGISDAENLLIELENEGVLESVSTYADERMWRLPTLLGEVLADSLCATDVGESERIFRVIADYWSSDRARLGQVLYYARDGKHWQLLTDLWWRYGMEMGEHHRSQFLHAYEDLPSEALAKFPDLGLAGALTVSLDNTDDEVTRSTVMSRIRNLGLGLGADLDSLSMGSERALAVAIKILSERVDNHLDRSLQTAENFSRDFAAASPKEQSEINADSLAWVDLEWGTTAMEAGRGEIVEETLNRAYFKAKEGNAPTLVARSAAQLALIHAIDGTIDEVHRWLAAHEASDVGTGWVDHLMTQPAQLARIMIAVDRLDEKTARDQLRKISSGARSGDFWHYQILATTMLNLQFGDPASVLEEMGVLARAHPGVMASGGMTRATLDRCTTDLLIALGQLNRAQRQLNSAGEENYHMAVPRARLALISGDASAARRVAAAFPADVRTLLRDRAEIAMIEAVAALSMNDEEAAVDIFRKGHRLAAQMGSLVPYTTIPTKVRNRLTELAGLSFDSGFLNNLQNARQVYPELASLVVLSAREKVVLRELRLSENAAQIAEALVVSVHTVKNQLASIYSKLQVHDRASALVQASRLGLLADDYLRG